MHGNVAKVAGSRLTTQDIEVAKSTHASATMTAIFRQTWPDVPTGGVPISACAQAASHPWWGPSRRALPKANRPCVGTTRRRTRVDVRVEWHERL